VPGHRNIEGNCIADELARQGTTADILHGKDTVGMPSKLVAGSLQAPSQAETVHTFQQPLELNLNMSQFYTHMAKLQLEKNKNSPTM